MTEDLTNQWPEIVVETAAHLPYPETPDIAGAVQQRLQPAPRQPRPLRWAVALAVLLLFVAAGLLAIPPVRAAVLDWLHIGAIEVFVVEEVPEMATAVPLSITDLGEPISLAEAQEIFPVPLFLPPAWDESGVVYSHDFFERIPVMTMQWQNPDGVILTFSQIAVPNLGMKWAGGEQVVETAVNGETAVWIEGPHPMDFAGSGFDFQIVVETNVLIWTDGDVTYRLEGQITQDEAVKFAESLP